MSFATRTSKGLSFASLSRSAGRKGRLTPMTRRPRGVRLSVSAKGQVGRRICRSNFEQVSLTSAERNRRPTGRLQG